MKRSILCAFALAMALSGTANGAIPTKSDIRSATSLANENVMTSNVGQAISSTPLGAIVAFNYNSAPLQYTSLRNGVSVPDYVLCDGGRIPPESDLCKVYGQCGNTPNLSVNNMNKTGRGFFLRGDAVAGTKKGDQMMSHAHDMQHVHDFAGELDSGELGAYVVDKEVSGKLDDNTIDNVADSINVLYHTSTWGGIGLPNGTGYDVVTYGATGIGPSGITRPINARKYGTTMTTSAKRYVHGHKFDGWSGSGGPVWGWTDDHDDTHSHDVIIDASTTTALISSHNVDAKIEDTETKATVANEGKLTAQVENVKSRGSLDSKTFSDTTHGVKNGYGSSGTDTGNYGSDETAPVYYTVRYYMRVNN